MTQLSPSKSAGQNTSEGHNLVGGVLTLFAEIVISMALAGLIKQISPDTSLITILFSRFFFCLPLLLWLGWYQRGTALYSVRQKQILAARIFSGLAGLCSWYVAVIYLPLSLATVLGQMLTIFITLLAPFLLGERVGSRRIGAVIFGFAGILLLINPFSEQTQPVPFIGLAAGLAMPFFAALMFIFLRRLGRSEAPISTALWYNSVGAVIFAGVMIASDAAFPVISAQNSFVWAVLIIAGVASSVQQFLMAWSHKLAPASALAPVHYSAVPVSVAIGMVFFDEALSLSFVTGTAIIIGSAWYIFRREQMHKHSKRGG